MKLLEENEVVPYLLATRWKRLRWQVPITVMGIIGMAIYAAVDWNGFVQIMSSTCNMHSC
jgi:hypothetical protein